MIDKADTHEYSFESNALDPFVLGGTFLDWPLVDLSNLSLF